MNRPAIDAPVPITLLTGFLGSGKTTLLRRWRREDSLRNAALIIHDLSDFGVDAELLSAEGAPTTPGHLHDRVAALHGSHARENLHPTLGRILGAMAALRPAPPLVLCESTGAARPWPLIAALTQHPRFFLRHFIVTVDALNLHRDFADGHHLSRQTSALPDPALRHAADLLTEQLAFASVILLTKIDTLPPGVADRQVAVLRKLQPRAAIGLSAQAGLLLSQLDATPAPPLSVLRSRARQLGLLPTGSATAITAEQIDASVFRDPRPFHPERLYDACRRHLGTGLYRTKGFLWLASRPGHVLLWQQSGSHISLELTGLWRAELARNLDGKLLPEEIAHLRSRLTTQHPVFGDRHNELTLIGLPAARAAFTRALEAALCTDPEISAWQRGEAFPDPWPHDLRKVS
ncbi:G3E family GTPase [Haloferula luteola]|uniref:G3E family GTPase n=1 Tax=Haloferula luteola TaxID=595692 RepID=A0A840UYQ0_9BACT|nr:GTP-binding protein [Haloferula luteola]MBB5349956.1 G3E family GTPase [Haloferula luteola]